MKKLIIFLSFLFFTTISFAQDFKQDIATARSSYAAGKLEDAHFALLQAMQEIDMIVGKEVLKLLPMKMADSLNVNTKDDHVMANSGYIGTTIHRSYGNMGQADIEIINNSPMISTLNAFLNTPLLGGMMRDENTKIVKVQGYKARLEKQGDDGNGKSTYNLQVPFGGALLTFNVKSTTESDILAMANNIPMQNIAELVQ